MSFSINTNVTSLQAQNYLTQSSTFQAHTINEVTSGLRIVNSGDDAAGLAVANGLASSQAVLTQGVQNANNGLATLQTIDGGMGNINTLLDRAQTLATESASGTFSGNRGTLNSEFQSVLTEINRQAQSIGMNSTGQFAKALSVFIGGGQGSTAAAQSANGTINIDLSKAAVDTKSLGLNGYTAGYQVASGAADTGLYDLSNSSTTNVTAIIAGAGSPTSATFTVQGAGFSGANATSLNVNLTGVSDTNSLVNAVNAAIQSAGSAGTAASNAFAAAGISASIHTGADGHQQLLFTSASSAFSVKATNLAANGFLGNLGTNTGGSATNATATPEAITGNSANFNAGGTNQLTVNYGNTAGLLKATPETQALTFSTVDGSGNTQTTTVTLTGTGAAGANQTAAEAAAQINTQLQATDNPALQGIVAVANNAGTGITFASAGSSQFNVTIGTATGGDGITDATGNTQGSIYSSATSAGGSNVDISTASDAQNAINALTAAVSKFGNSQAAVGRGENNLNYAVNLAQSQLTNQASAESTIKDANLAAEAANLTKAQILVQAGTAALAQANSAPQQLLSLLQGH